MLSTLCILLVRLKGHQINNKNLLEIHQISKSPYFHVIAWPCVFLQLPALTFEKSEAQI